jgi:glycolate oxidase/4-cresol dehydrogenase (hydroxylating)
MPIQAAMKEMGTVVGQDNAFQDPDTLEMYSRNMLTIENIVPAGVVKPTSVEEVQDIVKIANQYRVCLWPISTGQNHGYGMACAVKPGSIILDFARMNRILEVNTDLAYALVEPGVTYLQLYHYLRENKIPLWIDCPSSSPGSSPVGNTTERGVGYTPMAEHFLFSCGMEVVLPRGDIIRTGTGQLGGTKTWQIFKWGYGPYLDGLFTASNFGIVTKLGLWLMPEPPAYEPMGIIFDNPNDIDRIIETLRPLKINNLIHNGAAVTHVRKALGHVAVWGRSKEVLPKVGRRFDYSLGVLKELKETYNLGNWNCSFALYGLPETVQIHKKIIKEAFSSMSDYRFVDASEMPDSFYWHCRKKIMGGEPLIEFDMSDWVGTSGTLWISPVAPVQHEHVRTQIEIAEETTEKYGFKYSAELILGSGRDLHHIIWLMFDRSQDEEKGRAHQCAGEMIDRYCDVGYLPYRTNVAFMDHIMQKLGPFREVCHDLKKVFDPGNILSPGKNGIDLND